MKHETEYVASLDVKGLRGLTYKNVIRVSSVSGAYLGVRIRRLPLPLPPSRARGTDPQTFEDGIRVGTPKTRLL